MTRIQIRIGQMTLQAKLLEVEAPQCCRAILKALPFKGKVFHAMYSGTACIVPKPVKYEIDIIENRKAFMIPGSLYYFRPDGEVVIPYECTQFRTPVGSEYVTEFARFEGDVSGLTRVASGLQMTGAKDFVMERVK